jgi:hypothetical protein
MLPKRRSSFNILHGVISQKIEIFIRIAVRISAPTYRAMFQIKVTQYDLYCTPVRIFRTLNRFYKNFKYRFQFYVNTGSIVGAAIAQSV